jgi:hypothetical protein
MQRYTRLKTGLAEEDASLAVIVDAELFRLEGVVRWLDAADGRMRHARPAARAAAPARHPEEAAR